MNSKLTNGNNSGVNKSAVVKFEEVLAIVQEFAYDYASQATAGATKAASGPKSKNLAQTKKHNLEKLIATVAKIKGATIVDKSAHKANVRRLYKLITDKLGEDLYKFNIGISVKFLVGYKSRNADKLDRSVCFLFDNIIEYTSEKMKGWRIESEFSAINDAVDNLDLDFEFNLKQFIGQAVTKNCFGEKPSATKEQLVATVYIALLLKNRFRTELDKMLLSVERAIADYLAGFEQKELGKYLHKTIPEALLDANPRIKVKQFVFLCFGVVEAAFDIKKKNDKLIAELSDSRIRNGELIAEIEQLTESVEIKEKAITEMDATIVSLKEEFDKAADRLEYEVNKYEKQLSGLKSGLISKIKSDLRLELEGIGNLAGRLPRKEGDDLRLWVENIEQVLNAIGEKH
jgi:hypothetical protein